MLQTPSGLSSGASAISHDRRRYAFGHVICADAYALQLGHHPMGGKFFRNHINFHHTYYSKDHLVSRTYLGDKGTIRPFSSFLCFW